MADSENCNIVDKTVTIKTFSENNEGEEIVTSINDSETCTSDEIATSTTSPNKKLYKQSFNEEWLTDDDLMDWVKPDDFDKFVTICNICNCKLKNTNKTNLMNHKRSNKHKKNLTQKSLIKKRDFEFIPVRERDPKKRKANDSTADIDDLIYDGDSNDANRNTTISSEDVGAPNITVEPEAYAQYLLNTDKRTPNSTDTNDAIKITNIVVSTFRRDLTAYLKRNVGVIRSLVKTPNLSMDADGALRVTRFLVGQMSQQYLADYTIDPWKSGTASLSKNSFVSRLNSLEHVMEQSVQEMKRIQDEIRPPDVTGCSIVLENQDVKVNY